MKDLDYAFVFLVADTDTSTLNSALCNRHSHSLLSICPPNSVHIARLVSLRCSIALHCSAFRGPNESQTLQPVLPQKTTSTLDHNLYLLCWLSFLLYLFLRLFLSLSSYGLKVLNPQSLPLLSLCVSQDTQLHRYELKHLHVGRLHGDFPRLLFSNLKLHCFIWPRTEQCSTFTKSPMYQEELLNLSSLPPFSNTVHNSTKLFITIQALVSSLLLTALKHNTFQLCLHPTNYVFTVLCR